MEQQTPTTNVSSPPQPAVTPPPVQTAPAQTPPSSQVPKSGSPWPWILGGCLLVVIITLIGVFLLGWLGMREVKKEINKFDPAIEDARENFDKMGKEAEEWEKKSQEFRESMPNPEEFSKEIEAGE